MPPTPRDIDVARGFWAQAQEDLLNFQLELPNLLHESVPEGRDENDNQEIEC